jgi:hypothetical protein
LDRGHGGHLGWKTWWHQTFAMACVIMYGIKTYNVLHYIFHTQIQEIGPNYFVFCIYICINFFNIKTS